MKSILLKTLLALVITNLSLVITQAQTWKELMDCAKTYKEKQDYETALKWALQAEIKAKEEFGEIDTNYASSIRTLFNITYYANNFEKSIEYGLHCADIYKKIYGKISIENAEILHDLAYAYKKNKNINKADSSFRESLSIFRQVDSNDNKHLASCIFSIAQFNFQIGKYKEAETLYLEALEMNRRINKEDSPDLANIVYNTGDFYDFTGNFEKAEKYLLEALEIRRRYYKTDDNIVAETLNNLGVFYEIRNPDKAEKYFLECLDMTKRLFKGDHPTVALLYKNIGMLYTQIDRYQDAEMMLKANLDMNLRLYKGDNPIVEESLNNLGFCYGKANQFTKAEPLQKASFEMSSRLYKEDNKSKAISTGNLASLYDDLGRYNEAEQLYIDALNMYRRLYTKDNYLLIISMNNLATFYEHLGRYKESEILFTDALSMARRIYKTDHPNLFQILNNFGSFYTYIDSLDKAESLLNEAYEMGKKIYKNGHSQMAMVTQNLGILNFNKKNYKESASFIKQSVDITNKISKGENNEKSKGLMNQGVLYAFLDDNIIADSLMSKALEMKRRIYKRETTDLAKSINSLGLFYSGCGDADKAEPLIKEAMDMYRKLMTEYYPSFSEKEKMQFWNTIKNIYSSFYSFAINRYEKNPSILSYMYDNVLFTKSHLFNSESRIKRRILNSGDTNLILRFKTIISNKELLVKLYQLTESDVKRSHLNIDSIEIATNKLEKEISKSSELYAQSYEKKKITWKSIQPFLKPDEAAVEIIRFRYFDRKRYTDPYYAFLIVNDECIDNPEIVVLNNGKELEGDGYNIYRNYVKNRIPDNESFNLYWSKVYDKLKNYKKIYISADGVYNKLNLSTLRMPDGRFLLDVQEIQLLNSTKDLQVGYYKKQNESSVFNNAVLIGNPNFSLSESQLKLASEKLNNQVSDYDSYENINSIRGKALSDLPGTEKEIKDIEKFLKSKNWVVNSYLGDMALKTAVKSAISPRVLHIATHGMFLGDVKSENKLAFGFEEKKLLQNPLLRSGLFFTGADNYLKSDSTKPSGNDNGLLTAYEAMNLDLDNTELVVLSACETGLGDIQNGEGVFGLRRAFQQAGAKTVVMSLWTVNDDATQELMSNFYKHWVSGKTKREAFNLAQLEIKDKFKDPYYWGAFVMVGE